ncbi:MAG: type II secretion system protein [Chlamydiota bacterium]|nr:type II secretion system protein [Chlamydiota bacterium]
MNAQKENAGLSVIEMLASMTIIMILAALLMGSIGASYEKTKQSQCINNQHQLIDAVLLFALDNENFPDQIASLQGSYIPDYEDAPSYYNVLSPKSLYANAMGEYYNGQSNLLRCPKVKGTIFDNPQVFSYGLNAIVKGANYSDFIEPSEIVVLADSDSEEIGSPFDITLRHVFGAVAAFADGHVEWIKDFYPYTGTSTYENGELVDGEGPVGESGPTIGGDVNLNPNNSDDFEFEMEIISGTLITRDDLLGNSNLEYSGQVLYIRIKPKGNSNSNSMTLNGEPYDLQNGTLYMITGDDLTVHLVNDHAGKKGNAMGKWWLRDMTCSVNCSVDIVE